MTIIVVICLFSVDIRVIVHSIIIVHIIHICCTLYLNILTLQQKTPQFIHKLRCNFLKLIKQQYKRTKYLRSAYFIHFMANLK